MGTYHALQSLGELVGLKHVFALLMLGAVHHLWTIIDSLLYERRDGAPNQKRSHIFFLRTEECCRRLSEVTAVEVDGSNELQVGVYSTDAVDVSAVLQSRAD